MAKKLKIKISELNQKSNITGHEYMPSSYIANASEGWKSYKIGTTQLSTYIGETLKTFDLADNIDELHSYISSVKTYADSAYSTNKTLNSNISKKASDQTAAYTGYLNAHINGPATNLDTYIKSNVGQFHMNSTNVNGKGVRIGSSWKTSTNDETFAYVPAATETAYGVIKLTDIVSYLESNDIKFPIASDTTSGCISVSEVRDIISNVKHPFALTANHTSIGVTLGYNCNGSYAGTTTIPLATYSNYGVVNLTDLKTLALSYPASITYNVDYVLTYNVENVYSGPTVSSTSPTVAGAVTYNRVTSIAKNTGHDFGIRNTSDGNGNSILAYTFNGSTYTDIMTLPNVNYTNNLFGLVSKKTMEDAAAQALDVALTKARATTDNKGLVNGPLLNSLTTNAAKAFKTDFTEYYGNTLKLVTYYNENNKTYSNEATLNEFNGTTYGLTTYAKIESHINSQINNGNYTLPNNGDLVTNIKAYFDYNDKRVDLNIAYIMSSKPNTVAYLSGIYFDPIDNNSVPDGNYGVINRSYFNTMVGIEFSKLKKEGETNLNNLYNKLVLRPNSGFNINNTSSLTVTGTYKLYFKLVNPDVDAIIYSGNFSVAKSSSFAITIPKEDINNYLLLNGINDIEKSDNGDQKFAIYCEITPTGGSRLTFNNNTTYNLCGNTSLRTSTSIDWLQQISTNFGAKDYDLEIFTTAKIKNFNSTGTAQILLQIFDGEYNSSKSPSITNGYSLIAGAAISSDATRDTTGTPDFTITGDQLKNIRGNNSSTFTVRVYINSFLGGTVPTNIYSRNNPLFHTCKYDDYINTLKEPKRLSLDILYIPETECFFPNIYNSLNSNITISIGCGNTQQEATTNLASAGTFNGKATRRLVKNEFGANGNTFYIIIKITSGGASKVSLGLPWLPSASASVNGGYSFTNGTAVCQLQGRKVMDNNNYTIDIS